MTDGADVVLVRVREDEPGQVLVPFLDEGGIGHEHIDTGQTRIGVRHAEVDHQPAPGVAVEIEVHADLAGAAERQEIEFLGPGRFGHVALAR